MANYSKLKVIWRNNLNNIYKENTIIGVGQEAVINMDENGISNIYVNFKVNDDFFTDLVEINGNVIHVPFKTDVLKKGTHQLEIVAYLKNGDVVPSPTFSYYVEDAIENPNDITAETNYPILIQLLEEVEEWNENVKRKEIERQENENTRISNENTRISNENTRISNETNRRQYEDTRRIEEDERLTLEEQRQNAELQRIANENERLRREVRRQDNEQNRIIRFNEMEAEVEKFKADTNAAMTAHKNEVSEVVDGFDTQLAQIKKKGGDYIFLSSFISKDETTGFIDACEYCLNNSKTLFVDIDVNINLTKQIIIPSMYSISNNIYITPTSDDCYFVITDNLIIDGVSFISYNQKTVLNNINKTNNVLIKNCNFKEDVSFPNLGFTAIRLSHGCNNLQILNCKLSNYEYLFLLEGQSENLLFDNLKCYNFRTGIYLTTGKTTVVNPNYISSVKINNILFENTEEQCNEYRKLSITGRDGILLECVKDVIVSNITSNNMVERFFYCAFGKNMKITNINMYNSGEIKCVGSERLVVGSTLNTPIHSNISENFIIQNIVNINNKADSNGLELYSVKNVNINNYYYDGCEVSNAFLSSRFTIEDIKISNCVVKNIRRGAIQFQDLKQGFIYENPNVDDFLAGDYKSYMKNIEVDNCIFDNCAFYKYPIFRIDDTVGVENGYKYENIKITNNKMYGNNISIFDDNESSYYDTFTSIIDIDNVKHLLIDNNICKGYYNIKDGKLVSRLPFRVLSNSFGVVIKHNANIRYDFNETVQFNDIFVSAGSEININKSQRWNGVNAMLKVTPLTNLTDPSYTVELDKNFNIVSNLSVRAIEDRFLYMPLYGTSLEGNDFPYSKVFGSINICTSDGQIGSFSINKDGTIVKKSFSDDLFTTEIDYSKIQVRRFSSSGDIRLVGINNPTPPKIELTIDVSLQTAN